VIAKRNIFREFVTVHRGTRGGSGRAEIGDRNVYGVCAYRARLPRRQRHDLRNMATLGGHVAVEDFANVSAGSVHQFCRVGRHGHRRLLRREGRPAVCGTVGSRLARIYGLNIIGLMRRGFSAEVLAKLKGTFRYLLQSKLNTTSALQHIQQDRSLACAEVQYLLDFIRSSQRGVILRRATRRTEEVLAEE
jgi:UDP-N-acetylglucosamine acyltransferase